MGFHPVVWAGLKRLGSSQPPALASQTAGITDDSCQTQPVLLLIVVTSIRRHSVVFKPVADQKLHGHPSEPAYRED